MQQFIKVQPVKRHKHKTTPKMLKEILTQNILKCDCDSIIVRVYLSVSVCVAVYRLCQGYAFLMPNGKLKSKGP